MSAGSVDKDRGVTELRVAVNKIIPFSSVDGPGNRTAVFLQGCNINCKYCHNPETRKLCIGCGICVEKCPTGALSLNRYRTDGPENDREKMCARILYDAAKCVQCDTCIHACPNDSSPRTALMTPGEVFEQVKKQIPFIRGITVSGGECMLQPEFMRELFVISRQAGLTTMIDTNGTIDFERYPQLLAVTDGVMLDIKAFSDEAHRQVTDHTNEIVLKNAQFLAAQGKLFEVRCVIVPDLYDTEASVRGLAEFLAPLLELQKFRIKLIAYRPMGVREEYSHYQVPSKAHLEKLAKIVKTHGFEDIVII